MKEIMYYPSCKDVFDIDCQGGICYYMVDKKLSRAKVDRGGKNCKEAFIYGGSNYITNINGLYSLMPDCIVNIVHKVGGRY